MHKVSFLPTSIDPKCYQSTAISSLRTLQISLIGEQQSNWGLDCFNIIRVIYKYLK